MQVGDTVYFKYGNGSRACRSTVTKVNKLTYDVNEFAGIDENDLKSSGGIHRVTNGILKGYNDFYTCIVIERDEYDSIRDKLYTMSKVKTLQNLLINGELSFKELRAMFDGLESVSPDWMKL